MSEEKKQKPKEYEKNTVKLLKTKSLDYLSM